MAFANLIFSRGPYPHQRCHLSPRTSSTSNNILFVPSSPRRTHVSKPDATIPHPHLPAILLRLQILSNIQNPCCTRQKGSNDISPPATHASSTKAIYGFFSLEASQSLPPYEARRSCTGGPSSLLVIPRRHHIASLGRRMAMPRART